MPMDKEFKEQLRKALREMPDKDYQEILWELEALRLECLLRDLERLKEAKKL